jgi:transcriptional regulator with XRE-family HTH domain
MTMTMAELLKPSDALNRPPADFVEWLNRRKALLNLRRDVQLAEALHIRPDILSAIWAGRRGPSNAMIQDIIDALKIERDSPEYYELLAAAFQSNMNVERDR